LISESILIPAVRALPGDGIAGHPPHIFIHTLLADMETAPAAPAKAKILVAAMAGKAGLYTAIAPGPWFCGGVFHSCCFKVLLI